MDSTDDAQQAAVVEEWVGKSVVDSNGVTLGAITSVVPDPRGDAPWVTVTGAGLTGFVPTEGAMTSDTTVTVTVSRGQVLTAPTTVRPDRLSEFEAAALRRHFSRSADYASSDDGAGPDPVRIAAAASAVTALVALLVWVLRRNRHRPPTPAERLTSAGRTTTATVAARAKDLAVTARALEPVVAARAKDLAVTARAIEPVVAARAKDLASTAGTAAHTAGSAARVAGTAARTAATGAAAAAVPVVGEVAHEVGHLARRGAHAGAELATKAAAVAAPVAVTAAGAAAHGATDLASSAGELAVKAAHTSQKVGGAVAGTLAEVPEAVAEAVTERVDDLQRTWRKVTNRLTFALFLGLGYVLGARAGTERYDAIVRLARKAAGTASSATSHGSTGRSDTDGTAFQPLSTTPPPGQTMG